MIEVRLHVPEAEPDGEHVRESASRWRRLLARVSGWQAPPRNLLLSGLVLLVFPWDDILIDALYGAEASPWHWTRCRPACTSV
jgi:hypothetical protein